MEGWGPLIRLGRREGGWEGGSGFVQLLQGPVGLSGGGEFTGDQGNLVCERRECGLEITDLGVSSAEMVRLTTHPGAGDGRSRRRKKRTRNIDCRAEATGLGRAGRVKGEE